MLEDWRERELWGFQPQTLADKPLTEMTTWELLAWASQTHTVDNRSYDSICREQALTEIERRIAKAGAGTQTALMDLHAAEDALKDLRAELANESSRTLRAKAYLHEHLRERHPELASTPELLRRLRELINANVGSIAFGTAESRGRLLKVLNDFEEGLAPAPATECSCQPRRPRRTPYGGAELTVLMTSPIVGDVHCVSCEATNYICRGCVERLAKDYGLI